MENATKDGYSEEPPPPAGSSSDRKVVSLSDGPPCVLGNGREDLERGIVSNEVLTLTPSYLPEEGGGGGWGGCVKVTLKAGAEPFAIPVGDAGFMPTPPPTPTRFCNVLLEAICSNEMVPGSERRTSKECVPFGEEGEDLVVECREDPLGPTYSGGGSVCEGGCVPRGEGCGK